MFLKKDKEPKCRQSPQTSQKSASRTTKVKWTPKKVRPIQRVPANIYVCRRLPALTEAEIVALTAAVRQLRALTHGGAEAIFHQLILDEWTSGKLDMPPARIKVDEGNCFGLIEWSAVCYSASCVLPKHMEQEGVQQMAKDCGTEEGYVDGPSERRWHWRW